MTEPDPKLVQYPGQFHGDGGWQNARAPRQSRPQMPPPPPIEPRYKQTAHIVHALLTLFTAGLWAFIWIIAGATNASNNAGARTAYEREYAEWKKAYWEWQHQV